MFENQINNHVCVRCSEPILNKQDKVLLKCCNSTYHKDCIFNSHISNGYCIMCNKKIESKYNCEYTCKDVCKKCNKLYYTFNIHLFVSLCLYIIASIYVLQQCVFILSYSQSPTVLYMVYIVNRLQYLPQIVTLLIIWSRNLLCISHKLVKRHKICDNDDFTIERWFLKYFSYAIIKHDNKCVYISPINIKKSAFRLPLTTSNILKIYWGEIFVFHYSYFIFELFYAFLMKYLYINITTYCLLHMITLIIYNVPIWLLNKTQSYLRKSNITLTVKQKV